MNGKKAKRLRRIARKMSAHSPENKLKYSVTKEPFFIGPSATYVGRLIDKVLKPFRNKRYEEKTMEFAIYRGQFEYESGYRRTYRDLKKFMD